MHGFLKVWLSIFGLWLALAAVSVRAEASRTGRISLDLLSTPCEQFPGDTTCKEFFVQLPSHIDFPPGSEVALDFACEPALLSLVSGIEIRVNDRPIQNFSLDAKNPADGKIRLSVPLPPRALQSGWNRITAHFAFRKTAQINQDLLKSFSWSAEKAGSGLRLVYERMEQFPELRLFPNVSGQEKLLQPGPPAVPAVNLLLPNARRAVHSRACAVVGARFGQLGYLSERDCRLGLLDNWKGEMDSGSGLLVGCKDELPPGAVPADVQAKLAALEPQQGLLGEFVTGSVPNQKRWLIVSGADDAGLEKAVLTLGSTPALTEAGPNPAIISQAPPPHPAAVTATANIAGLQQLNSILIRDTALEKTVFILPAKAGLGELKLLFDLALYLGAQLPHSPALRPDACSYSRTSPTPPERVQGRSVLLLAPVAEWQNTVPPGIRLGVAVPDPQRDVVRIQARSYKLDAFDPSLVFLHLVPSPWTKDEHLVAAGGLLETSPTLVKRMIQSAAPGGTLFGNLCAMDAAGRTLAYDTRDGRLESFAEALQRKIPPGLTVAETHARLKVQAGLSHQSAQWNRVISWIAATWLVLLAGGRVLLLWQREWSRRRAMRHEKQWEPQN